MRTIESRKRNRRMKALAKIALAVACLTMAAQTADPIPDKLRTDLLRTQRDQLAAERDKQAAMMTYHAAESRYEASKHNLAVLQSDAEQRCAAAGRKFDADQVACIAK